jgi:hypothetical protein
MGDIRLMEGGMASGSEKSLWSYMTKVSIDDPSHHLSISLGRLNPDWFGQLANFLATRA